MKFPSNSHQPKRGVDGTASEWRDDGDSTGSWRGAQGNRVRLESASRIGDRLFHGRLRYVDSWLHALCHLNGPIFDKRSGRLTCNVDVSRCRCGRTHFWNSERPFWSNQGTDVDHSDICIVHWSLRL